MPHCPRSSKKDAVASHYFEGIWNIMCPVCLFYRKVRHGDYDTSLGYFWEAHNSRNEEKTMTSDYKRGVEDALTPMREDDPTYNDPNKGCLSYFEFTNEFLKDRLKRLLTKKVTKWVAVYNQNGATFRPCYTSHVFDTYEEATRSSGCVPCVATVPVEIEVPID